MTDFVNVKHQRMKAKEVFSSLDMMRIVSEIDATAVGGRVSNVYDIDNKTYLLKLSLPHQSESGSEKLQLLIERGVRLHATKYIREKQGGDMPSVFAMKLRKYLKNKRLDSVQQLGMDRVCDMRFGSSDAAVHLIIELYSLGNIILTDHTYRVLALLRTHKFENDVVCKEGEPYPIAYSTSVLQDEILATRGTPAPSSSDGLEVESDENSTSDAHTVKGVLDMSVAEFRSWAADAEQRYTEEQVVTASEGKGSKKKPKRMYVKQLLLSKYGSGVTSLGPDIIDHCIARCGDPWARNTAVVSINSLRSFSDDAVISQFLGALAAGVKTYEELSSATRIGGYVLYDEMENENERYVDFSPVLLAQHEGRKSKYFDSFAAAVDEYFCKVEEQRLVRAAALLEEQAHKKINKVKAARTEHIAGIEETQQKLGNAAALVEMHAEGIDKLAMVINSAVDNDMSWDDIQLMVDEETENGNPIASMVVSLNLEKNQVVVRLGDDLNSIAASDDDDDDDDDEGGRNDRVLYEDVEVDISISAHANASALFKRKKLANVHHEKATKASALAVNSVEDSVMRQLETNKLRISLKSARSVHWFEKFAWFISSEGYLVISGRSDHQTEAVLRKYMRPDDVCVYADIPDAQPCILRRRPKIEGSKSRDSISPYAIHEAGTLCVCRSSAWNKKAAASPWWVWGAQVMLAPVGTASAGKGFTFGGHKNFLPPMRMELGFGVMFRLDDASAERHAKDRKIKGAHMDDDTMSIVSEAADRYGLDAGEALYEFDAALIERELAMSAKASVNSPQRQRVGSEDGDRGSHDNSKKGKNKKTSRKDDNNGEKEVSFQESDTASKADSNHGGPSRKKKVDKKKARRYAEQDDEDRELAMAALGHSTKGSKLKDRNAKKEQELRVEEEIRKREQAGVSSYVGKQHASIMSSMHGAVRAAIDDLVEMEMVEEGEIGTEDLATLVKLPIDKALEALKTFGELLEEGMNREEEESDWKIGNKSALLAGVMIRLRNQEREKEKDSVADNDAVSDDEVDGAGEGDSDSIHSVDDSEEKDESIMPVVEDDTIAEMTPEELASMDDVSTITGYPKDEDVLLYCIPCCGPYSAIQSFKYRVKLTPGTQKQGQVAKTVMDLFAKGSSWISEAERGVMQGMGADEVIPTLIRNTKINLPGLQAKKIGVAIKEAKKRDARSSKQGKKK